MTLKLAYIPATATLPNIGKSRMPCAAIILHVRSGALVLANPH